jgi:Ca2+/Na+ antiporter
MLLEIIKVIKKVVWVGIVVALFKIYENKGFVNPVTMSVLLIIFGLWLIFKLELNEEVEVEIEERENQFQDAPPTPTFATIPTSNLGSTNTTKQSTLCQQSNPSPEIPVKRLRRTMTKLRRLIRSRSRSTASKE